MAWSTSYLPDQDAVFSVYSGVISPEALYEAVHSALEVGRQNGTRKYLSDLSGLVQGPSIVDLYNLAKLLDAAGADPGTCEALVLPHLDAAAIDVRFWETTCQNRGYSVRVFDTLEEAGAWLATQDAGRPDAQPPTT